MAGESNGGARKLRIAVGIVVATVWAAAAIASLIDDRYVPLEIISPVMLLLAGYLFGVQMIRPGRGGGGE